MQNSSWGVWGVETILIVFVGLIDFNTSYKNDIARDLVKYQFLILLPLTAATTHGVEQFTGQKPPNRNQ